MGYDSKGILVLNLKYEHAISFINLVKFIAVNNNQFRIPERSLEKLDKN